MAGGQSLDEIVSQNAKAMRRQSMPHQFSGNPNNMDSDMRRISMMEYGSGSPAGPLGNFQYDPNTGMNQNSMMPGNRTPTQHQNQHQHSHQQSHDRRQSQGDLALNTSFVNTSQSYNPMMPQNPSYSSPAHPQSGFEMTMDSPYIDSGMNMQMDYNVDQNLANQSGSDMHKMNLYGQQQFNQQMMNSPIPHSGSQGTPLSAQGPSHEQAGGSSMSTPFGGHANSSAGTVRHSSRRQSLQLPNMPSPAHSGGVTPLSQPPSATVPEQGNVGFRGQPQHPQPGSQQDRGMGRTSQGYDGVNGPLPVNTANYNPNSQGFNWDTPDGGWPSTMVGKPHMQTTYKNAYSSTGFDMLGVLVRATSREHISFLD